jgi:hypothetical protein
MPKPRITKGEYEHFKGNHYEVLGLAKHSETLEELVLYKALYGKGEMWVRPIKSFLEKVEKDGKKVKRFKLVK